jgi:NTE family protein
MVKKKKVALLLSSGSAKGFAHLGVLKVLEKNKIPIDLIIGTSMGSLVGAHYAMVPNASYWIKKLSDFSLLKVLDIKDVGISKGGLIKGNSVEKLLKLNLENATFKKTLIPLIINGVNFTKRKLIKFDRGKIRDAIRVSISIPVIFEGVRKEGDVLVDGGIMDPIGAVWLKGKWDLVIVVNVNTAQNKISDNNHINIFLRMFELLQREIVYERIKEIDNVVLIEPDMRGLSQLDYHKSRIFVKRGEQAAEKAMKEIKKFI